MDLRGGREALGGDALRKARRLLERSCAKSAAKALIAIDDVAKSCDTDASAFVKAAERAVREGGDDEKRCMLLELATLDADVGKAQLQREMERAARDEADIERDAQAKSNQGYPCVAELHHNPLK